jgi:hypothetical protein
MKFSNFARFASIALLTTFAMGAAQATTISATTAYSAYSYSAQGPYYAGNTGYGEISRLYEKFVLPTFAANTVITSAFFSFDITSVLSNYMSPLGLFTVANDGWTTNTSWANKAPLGAMVTSFTPTVKHYSIDVTSYINSQYSGDGVASLALAGLSEGSGQTSWSYFFGAPAQLTYTVAAMPANVPEPGSLALLGLGIAGLGMARRRRVQK